MLTRGLVGYSFCCLGALSVVFAGGTYGVGEWRQQQARRAWEESQARAIVAFAWHSAASTASDVIAPGVPVARLFIPRLRVDEIVLEGVDDNTLNGGPGHLSGSAFPGERGNSIISAHRDRHFARLGALEVGDTVLTESGSRQDRWVVTSKRVIADDAPALFRTSDATLTLTTCWPIRFVGAAPERLVITAKLARPDVPEGGGELPLSRPTA